MFGDSRFKKSWMNQDAWPKLVWNKGDLEACLSVEKGKEGHKDREEHISRTFQRLG